MINCNDEIKRPGELVVFAKSDANKEELEQLKKRENTTIIDETSEQVVPEMRLQLDADGLAMVDQDQILRGDFTRMLPRIKTSNLQRELLVKASKLKGFTGTPTAIDATAGLGEDAILLAAAGFEVKLYERDPVIAALLQDALRRAAEVPELAEIVGRMHFLEEDSLTALAQLEHAPEVILLDPMFPARQKSALIKKKFQILQQLESPCSDEEALVQAAITCHPRKVVIKRPLKGPYLAGRKPDYSLKGKAIRYDCIVLPPQKENECRRTGTNDNVK